MTTVVGAPNLNRHSVDFGMRVERPGNASSTCAHDFLRSGSGLAEAVVTLGSPDRGDLVEELTSLKRYLFPIHGSFLPIVEFACAL